MVCCLEVCGDFEIGDDMWPVTNVLRVVKDALPFDVNAVSQCVIVSKFILPN